MTIVMIRRRSDRMDDATPLALRSEAAPAVTEGPPYRYEPTRADIARFVEHVAQTGQPETFPTICNTKPPPGSEPVFLKRFSIERRKRPDGDMAPCPICSPHAPKYLIEGYLVWYRDEGVIRAIGPECGDSIFGGTAYADGKRKLEAKEREEAALDFLQKNLCKTSRMIFALNAMFPAVKEAERLYTEFKARAPDTHARLRAIRKTHGQLEVSKLVERSEGPRGFGERGSAYDTRTVVLGVVPNSPILNSKLNAMVDWLVIRDKLTIIPVTHDEDEAFSLICDTFSDLDAMERLESVLRKCAEDYVRLVDRLDRFASFFSETLFHALSEWGHDPDNDFRLWASIEEGAFTLRHHSTEILHRRRMRREEVSLRPDFDALARRGKWPGFE